MQVLIHVHKHVPALTCTDTFTGTFLHKQDYRVNSDRFVMFLKGIQMYHNAYN